ncbi:MAG TPA: monovalent cation/H+ antiporter complex subunit F [Candidatus Acidoferrales bacterium]|jgi:multicomponent Na+:H+ antiporter subunit F|nr:monovalent cation/H+ antiporter complex subunit F [Candidatus Angelobacter sp.]HWG86372.1 monovalent cation/H+ antiporter complex subunit F [Candidatus Acidoferrales bacterium]
MNPWLISALALIFALVPAAIVAFHGDPMDRMVGLEFASIITTLALMLLAHGFQRFPFYDIALAAALLSFGGGLVFIRFLERWL